MMGIMSTATRKLRTVEVDLPGEVFDSHPWEPDVIAAEMRVLWLVEQVRARRLAHGKAAELAGLSRERFLQVMGAHGVSPFDYDAGELADELAP